MRWPWAISSHRALLLGWRSDASAVCSTVCCFGGVCDESLAWSVKFPEDSPPYVHQRGYGLLHGLRIADDGSGNVLVADIDTNGPMREVDIAVGQRIASINGVDLDSLNHARSLLEESPAGLTMRMTDGRQVNVWLTELPKTSLPIHPTQLYSSINALLLAVLVALVFPFRQRHGQVIALLLTLYAITRFLLEIIRTDESAFMAQLTISQNVSVAIAVAMLALWAYVYLGRLEAGGLKAAVIGPILIGPITYWSSRLIGPMSYWTMAYSARVDH